MADQLIDSLLKHKLEPKQIVRVVGFVGTGKTKTLANYAENCSTKNFLLFGFFRKVRRQDFFPPNVEMWNIHRFAYEQVGKHYKEKIVDDDWTFDPMILVKSSDERKNESTIKNYKKNESIKIIRRTVINFINSADLTITPDHIPNTSTFPPEEIIKDATSIWDYMKDPLDTRVSMSHDGYVKIWQLKLNKKGNNLTSYGFFDYLKDFDYIMVDQAEHFNKAMMDIVMKANEKYSCIVAGDVHQNIYPFRNGQSPFEVLKATYTYYLTKSFNFGPNIANIANMCIDENLEGNEETPDSVVDSHENFFANPSTVVLARTWEKLWEKIHETYFDERGLKIAYTAKKIKIIGLKDDFRQVLETFLSQQPTESLMDENINHAERWVDSFTFVFHDEYKRNLMVNIMEPYTNDDVKDAVYGTVHGAMKTMTTWKTVVLLDDLFYFNRVLYVAATRARSKLVLNSDLYGEYTARRQYVAQCTQMSK